MDVVNRPLLRQATKADIPEMSRIRLAVAENRLRDPERVSPQMYEDFLERDGRGWVAQVDGVIVAFSYANRTDGTIWALFVDPAHEGKGLAKVLLGLATRWLFEIGYPEVKLDTRAGTRADRFYTRQGWTRTQTDDGNALFSLIRPEP